MKKTTGSAKRIHAISRSDEALFRIHVSPQQLAEAPQITPLLKKADGGLKQVLAAMRFLPDDVITVFLRKYDSIPVGDRSRLSIEGIALAAGLDISHLLGSIMLSLQSQAINTVKIIAMTAHPRITAARVKYGQLPLGERDRTALDIAMGFLPSPKGPMFIGKAVFGTGRSATEQQRDDDEEGELLDDLDMDKLFPPANAMQQKLTPIRQRIPPPEISKVQ